MIFGDSKILFSGKSIFKDFEFIEFFSDTLFIVSEFLSFSTIFIDSFSIFFDMFFSEFFIVEFIGVWFKDLFIEFFKEFSFFSDFEILLLFFKGDLIILLSSFFSSLSCSIISLFWFSFLSEFIFSLSDSIVGLILSILEFMFWVFESFSEDIFSFK